MTSLRVKHKCYLKLNPEKCHKDVSFAENVSRKSRTSVSQSVVWEQLSNWRRLFKFIQNFAMTFQQPGPGGLCRIPVHMCGNGPLRRTNKMSDMLETNNLDLKSVAMMFICENPLSASAELIGTVCSIQQRCQGTCHFRRLHIFSKLWNDVNHIHTRTDPPRRSTANSTVHCTLHS